MRSVQHLMRLAREGWEHRDWYEDVQPALQEAVTTLEVEKNRLIDVLALTSPKCAVKRNVKITVRYLTTGTLPSDVMRNTRVALSHYEETGEIRGPKTSRFASALKGDTKAIVLDTWMAIALDVDQKKFATKWMRSCAERRIRYSAHIMGIEPRQFQAACWAGTVMRHGLLSVPRIEPILLEEIRR